MVKRMMAGLMTLLFLCLFVGCGNRTLQAEISESVQEQNESLFNTEEPETEHIENETPDSNGQKILVAYFSRTGNTESLASEIGTYTGGELFEIVPVEPYPEDYDETVERFRRERDENARPAIANSVDDMERYTVVFVGYPIWGGDMPHIVCNFLEQYDFSEKTIIPFCTNGGSGFGDSLDSLNRLCPDATIAEGFECNGNRVQNEKTEIEAWLDSLEIENMKSDTAMNETEVSEVKIKITVGDTELTATLENNATTQAIIEQMPMTLSMMDLYGREMCYRYGAYALPTDDLRSDGYEVGDIAYWAPGGSLVILYAQNGEQFERQHLGHIDSGVEVFENTGDVDVTFELMD